ncbi:PREDICTED: uncharacterized protein LOC105853399 isoform X2 [Condylura cristata]|uniref:uncharacterized protein LOC105853399 isoform X1 n=1 Tax=Condylura cristata TaxID=143302 RepID=UPI0006437593|nr:PREDICTED: uncharacterized protein LOC105853399 isoform X1 [Condylura cristata]XP_012577824.1 PREDICTED: uncharacterized protein LOC105853399 isoform X2 [Condylura cristata]
MPEPLPTAPLSRRLAASPAACLPALAAEAVADRHQLGLGLDAGRGGCAPEKAAGVGAAVCPQAREGRAALQWPPGWRLPVRERRQGRGSEGSGVVPSSRASARRRKYLQRWHLEALLHWHQAAQQARRPARTWRGWVDAWGAEQLAQMLVTGGCPVLSGNAILFLLSHRGVPGAFRQRRLVPSQSQPREVRLEPGLKPRTDPGRGLHTRGDSLPMGPRGGGGGPGRGSQRLSPQLREWQLRWVWRAWRRRVLQLRVAQQLQRQQGGWLLPQVAPGLCPRSPQRPAALQNGSPLAVSEPGSAFCGQGGRSVR